MELKHINIKKCPQCGCSEVVNEFIETSGQQIRYHINGKRWEQREFACGYAVRFDPNFNEMSEERHCRNSIREHDIADIVKKTVEYIKSDEAKESFKDGLWTECDECFNIYTGEVRIVSDDVLADQGLYKTLLKPDYFYLSGQQYPLFDSEGNYAGMFHHGTFKDMDDIVKQYANCRHGI